MAPITASTSAAGRDRARKPTPAPIIAPRTLPNTRRAPRELRLEIFAQRHRFPRSMAQLIDGKAIAAKVRAEVAEGVKRLQASKGIVPGLAVVRVGEDPASKVYVGGKRK